MASTSLLVAGIATAAGPGESRATTTGKTADTAMPSTVETFGYPNAAKILAERNLKLKRGDGHIVLAECGSAPDLLQFIGRDRGDFCFRTIGGTGYLSLEVPGVVGVQTSGHKAHINMTVDAKTKSYDIAKNDYRGIGETTDPEGRDHTLVEIRTSK
ncbi:hypothetical protein [Streptomyces sp. NPDC056670]|uniref:hypothetical protein n=1 Tax=unclassified Streptomyces TaxID=2593676 RepID=UPI0036A68880